MAELSEDRYYKRSGDSFRKMEHFDLADMFGRRQRPDLAFKITPSATGEDEVETLRFGIINTGRSSAHHAGFLIQFPHDTELVGGAMHPLQDISSFNAGSPTVEFSDNVGVIHPNGIIFSCGAIDIRWPEPQKALALQAKIYCDGMLMKQGTISVNSATLDPT